MITYYSGEGKIPPRKLSLITPISNDKGLVCEHYAMGTKSGYYVREGIYQAENDKIQVAITAIKGCSKDLMKDILALKSNNHDNVARVLNFLSPNNSTLKIISEFVKGINLSQYLIQHQG